MNLFLKRFSFFLIPIIISFFIFEISLRVIPNDYAYKNAYLQNNAAEIEVLILGNSHTYRGVIPERLYLNSFNAAYISQSLDLDFLIFNKYKNQLKNLKYLVLNVSYPSLFSSLETSVENWRLKNYNIYYDFAITNKPKNYSEILSNTFKINKKRFKQYYLNHESLISCSYFGEGTLEENRNLEETALKAAKRHTKSDLQYYREYLKGLNNIIKFAKSHDIKIILVTPPAYKEYVNNLNKNQLGLMNAIVDSLVLSTDNVFRKDFLNDPNFSKKDYLNADHLNKKGAEKMTFYINDFIKSLSN